MKQPFFTGACTALVTPFLGGKVNYPMMEQLLRRQIDAGIEAVVICGTTGESATLSDCEKLSCSAGQRHTSGQLSHHRRNRVKLHGTRGGAEPGSGGRGSGRAARGHPLLQQGHAGRV